MSDTAIETMEPVSIDNPKGGKTNIVTRIVARPGRTIEDIPSSSEIIEKFHNDNLGRAISVKNGYKEQIVGYILSVTNDNSRHFVVFSNGDMFVIKPSIITDEEKTIYKDTYSANKTSLALGEWATSAEDASEYIKKSSFCDVVFTNDTTRNADELPAIMDQAIMTATENKMDRERAKQESVKQLVHAVDTHNINETTDQEIIDSQEETIPHEDHSFKSDSHTSVEEAFQAVEEHTAQIGELYKELALLELKEHAGTITDADRESKALLLDELTILESNEPEIPSQVGLQAQEGRVLAKRLLERFLKHIRRQMKDIERFYKELPGYFIHMHKWKKGVYHQAKELNILSGLTGNELKVANKKAWKSIYAKSLNDAEKFREENSQRLKGL